MSLDFRSDQPVTIGQLIDAGIRCGIVVTKNTLHKYTYTMTWDVDDYENYATNVLTNPETKKAFRELIKPRGDRFVMERDFELYGDSFSYCYSTRCDDAGIAHRLFDELDGVTLITLDEYHQSTFEEDKLSTMGDMGQEEVAAEIEAESYDDTVDDSRDTDGYGGRFCEWSRTGYPLERSAVEQDEVALTVEVEHEDKKQANH